MRRVAGTAVLLIALSIPVRAAAQVRMLEPGLRVRLDASPVIRKRVIGTIMSRTGDTLTIASSATLWHRIAVPDVRRIDVSGGHSRVAGARMGLLTGGLAFAGLTAVLTAASAKDPAFLIAAFGAGGAGVGLVVGAAIGTEAWRRVAQPQPPIERTRPGLVR